MQLDELLTEETEYPIFKAKQRKTIAKHTSFHYLKENGNKGHCIANMLVRYLQVKRKLLLAARYRRIQTEKEEQQNKQKQRNGIARPIHATKREC